MQFYPTSSDYGTLLTNSIILKLKYLPYNWLLIYSNPLGLAYLRILQLNIKRRGNFLFQFIGKTNVSMLNILAQDRNTNKEDRFEIGCLPN